MILADIIRGDFEFYKENAGSPIMIDGNAIFPNGGERVYNPKFPKLAEYFKNEIGEEEEMFHQISKPFYISFNFNSASFLISNAIEVFFHTILSRKIGFAGLYETAIYDTVINISSEDIRISSYTPSKHLCSYNLEGTEHRNMYIEKYNELING